LETGRPLNTCVIAKHVTSRIAPLPPTKSSRLSARSCGDTFIAAQALDLAGATTDAEPARHAALRDSHRREHRARELRTTHEIARIAQSIEGKPWAIAILRILSFKKCDCERVEASKRTWGRINVIFTTIGCAKLLMT
jgi:hypothetical protein